VGMREVDVTELAELIERLWLENVLQCCDGGDEVLDSGLLVYDSALVCRVGVLGGVGGRSTGIGVCCEAG